MLRGGLISMLYSKSTDLSVTAIDPASAMTLMSADIERITTGLQTMHELWVNLIEVGIAIYLLERQLGVACVVPIAVAICKFALIPYENTLIDGISFFGRIPGRNKSRYFASSNVA
jgi:ATP-binding cassette, subfamily C (CFTR/MRP), member 1